MLQKFIVLALVLFSSFTWADEEHFAVRITDLDLTGQRIETGRVVAVAKFERFGSFDTTEWHPTPFDFAIYDNNRNETVGAVAAELPYSSESVEVSVGRAVEGKLKLSYSQILDKDTQESVGYRIVAKYIYKYLLANGQTSVDFTVNMNSQGYGSYQADIIRLIPVE